MRKEKNGKGQKFWLDFSDFPTNFSVILINPIFWNLTNYQLHPKSSIQNSKTLTLKRKHATEQKDIETRMLSNSANDKVLYTKGT